MPDGTTRLRGAAAALPAAAARAIRRERTARDYLPYLGHAAPWAVLLEGGGLLGMLCLAGAAWEAADPAEVNGAHARLNVLLRNVASDRLVLLVHVVRTFADAREYPAGRFRSGFAAALDAAYRDRLLGRTLWRNHVFLSVLRRPPLPAGERVGSWLARRRGPAAEATAADLRALDETMQVLAADLAGYGAIRLGLRAANGIAFSEIGEALRLVLTGDPSLTPGWLRSLVEHLMRERLSAIADMGGGDTSLARLIADLPSLAETMEEAGVAPVAAYFLGPRVDDLSSLATFEASGFRPRATILVLNAARVDAGLDPAEAFAPTRRHSAFRGAVARGAVVVEMPRLDPPELALEVERKRLGFGAARDGEGSLGPLDRAGVRAWMDRMEAAFASVEGWLP